MGTRLAPSPPPDAAIVAGPASLHGRLASLTCPGPLTVLGAITVAAAVLRFATLDLQSIWLDESATILLVQRGFSGMLSHLPSSESTPPLYYVLAWLWTRVFGAGPLGFRSFSALAGTLTIPALYVAGRQVSVRVGLWAAALAAINPAMYYYSQEARTYALLILFSVLAFVMWQRALAAPSARRLGWWAALSILALLTHYFAVFLFVPEAVVLVRRLGWRRLRVAIGAVVLVGIALTPLALRQRSDGKSDWIQTTSLASRFAQFPKQFLIGLYGPVEVYSTVLAGLLAAAAVLLLVRRGSTRERRAGWDVAVVAVSAIALPLALAVTHLQDVFNGRNVIAAWGPWAVLIAIGLGTARAPRAGAALGAALCVVFALVIAGIDTKSGYQRDDWRGIAHALPASSGGRVIVSQRYGSLPLEIYIHGLHTVAAGSVSTREVDFVGLRGERTGRSPRPPQVSTSAPPGFRLVGVHRTASYVVARFAAPHATAVTVAQLRSASRESLGDVALAP